MAEYSAAFKARVVKQLVGPQAVSATRLAAAVGVPQPTLSRWVREVRSVGDMPRRVQKEWTGAEKLRVVLAAAGLDESALGALLGLAAGDAVGTTLEFKRPGTFEPISDLIGGGPFGRDLLQDVIPFVEGNFRTLEGADNRAIGGLSMGGGQTAAIAFANPDLFRYVVIMSAGSANAVENYPAFFKDPAAANRKFKLLWLGIGKDDALVGPGAQALHDALTAKGITHTFRLTEGRHEWVVWRHHLHEVAPLLFR